MPSGFIAGDGQQDSPFDDILPYLARNTTPGGMCALTVRRGGEPLDVPLTLSLRPS